MDSIFIGNLRVNVATTHRSQKRDAKRNREAVLSHPIDRYSRKMKNLRKIQRKEKECYKRGFGLVLLLSFP